MDFVDQIRFFSKKAGKIKDNIQTEEATKTSIIMPFSFKMITLKV